MAPLALRNESKVFLFLPDARCSASMDLEQDGSYLCVSLTGDAELERDDERQTLTAGKLHILRQPAGARHRRLVLRSAIASAVVVYISPRWCLSCPRGPSCKVAQFLLRGNENPAGIGDQALDLDSRGLAVARSLLDSQIDQDADLLTVEQSLLALLSWAFVKSASPLEVQVGKNSVRRQTAIKVRKAAEILRQRVENPPTIAELSVSVGLNESDLKRCFKCLYGDGIASYSRQRRLDAARDLLRHSALGVAAIALEVGFTNPSQFASAFRRQFGVNPSEYRRTLG
ncbi:MAG: AraC family transcriptional regulator [Pseudolabrys sp.]|nr:AraC family transcriptional regulator [Pseudolabrys sp.]